MHRLRKGLTNQKGFLLEGGPPDVFLAKGAVGAHYGYPTVQAMKLWGWVKD
jgi:hypothetical protein